MSNFISMRAILDTLVDSGEKWCNSPLAKTGVFNRADEQDSTNLTTKAAETWELAPAQNLWQVPQWWEQGKAGRWAAYCMQPVVPGCWSRVRQSLLPPLKAAAVIPCASPCSYCQRYQLAAALQNDSDVNQL